jgi:hypothetical protein
MALSIIADKMAAYQVMRKHLKKKEKIKKMAIQKKF